MQSPTHHMAQSPTRNTRRNTRSHQHITWHFDLWRFGLKINLLIKVKVCTLDTAPLCSETPPQKCSGMTCVLKGFHSFTCTPTCSSAIGMSHTCLCLPSYSWYSFTDPRAGGMEGWVGLGGWLRSETVYLPEGSHPSHYYPAQLLNVEQLHWSIPMCYCYNKVPHM